ncbi:MAG TPA: RNA polymerase sigma-70 factor [Parasegetibacter sp.]
MEFGDQETIKLLGERNEKAFERVFKTYYKDLHAYAFTILRDDMAAEEMVQNVFYKIWEKLPSLNFSGSVAAYLYKAVHNESLNYLKHLKVRQAYHTYTTYLRVTGEQAERKLVLSELESRLSDALNELPEQCRTIFQMSRFEELRYTDIAGRLKISVKTVENQMGKALKRLRHSLADYLPHLILILLNI